MLHDHNKELQNKKQRWRNKITEDRRKGCGKSFREMKGVHFEITFQTNVAGSPVLWSDESGNPLCVS